MIIDTRRAVLLGVFWLLSAGCAFLVGRGEQIAAITDPSDVRPAGFGNGPGASEDQVEEQEGQKTKSETRRANTVGRFISVTRRLSHDELTRLLPEITEKMSLTEVREALERLKKVRPGPARRLARLELMNRFGQLDALAAFKHIESSGETDLLKDMVYQAIKGWASVDPAAAHAHVTGEAGFVKDSLRAVWEGIAKTNDLKKALAYIPELGAGSNGYSEPYEIWDIYMTLHELFSKDDKAVVAWVEGLPPGETRNRAFHSTVDQMARHDPLAAKEWIEEQADPSNIAIAHVELAESWARHDPEAAVEWVAALPPNTEGLRNIYERLFTRFIQYDFLDAANYLVQQDPSPALDTAFEVYIDKVKTIDPGSTMDWAIAITDQSRRWTAIQEVANVWRGRDAEALNEYVGGLDLSEEQQNTLLGK